MKKVVLKTIAITLASIVLALGLFFGSFALFSPITLAKFFDGLGVYSLSINFYESNFNKTKKVSDLAIIAYDQVRMANLSIITSHYVNGVSALHSDILKKSLFKDFAQIEPEKFGNVTNGIAHRRWLCQANPKLTGLITDLIGDGFVKDASQLTKLNDFLDDSAVHERMAAIKLANKELFAQIAKRKLDVNIDPSTRFDVHVKRLHEYKRQLLNALKIVWLYHELKENPDMDITPQTFIFGAKAAPSYYAAKEVIKLICCIQKELETQPKIREKLNIQPRA